jgi:predicted PhzF superfamily epimerase YddE/YHI9
VAAYHLLNVFTAADGAFGNPLGVFLDGQAVAEPDRQAVAAELGYSEIVFVDDAPQGRVRIFTPASEFPFAGHPLVGTAWLLDRELGSCEVLRPPAGDVPTWAEDDLRWIRGRAEWAPPMELLELRSVKEVDALDGAPAPYGIAACWSWVDEQAGVMRLRVFAPIENIHEDEATGAAAVRLGDKLGRRIEIRQGQGSVLYARPGPDGSVDVAGRVHYVGEREL